jgi:hypothetical protein
MPLMYGIAAFAVLANGLEQVGVDPQIDKQYAIVKSGDHITPADSHANSSSPVEEGRLSSGRSIVLRTDAQQGTTTQQGTTNVNSASAPKQGQAVEPPAATITHTSQNGALVAPGTPTVPALPMIRGQRLLTVPAVSFFGNDNLTHLKGMDRLVSVQFTNATAADVLKWLAKQNVNFVANVDKLPKSKITMNVSRVPLHEALETVAEALGGEWQLKGSTLILQNGMFGSMTFPTNAFGTSSLNNKTMPFGDMKLFSQIDDKQFKAFELDRKKMGEDLANQINNMKSLYSDGSAFGYKMDSNKLEELKALSLTQDGRKFNFQWDPKAFGDMKNFAHMKEFKKMKSFTFKKINVEKFKKSLSISQKELLKKQGYLKFSDLTDEQRGMIFDRPNAQMSGNFTFVFGSDAQKITIKNK